MNSKNSTKILISTVCLNATRWRFVFCVVIIAFLCLGEWDVSHLPSFLSLVLWAKFNLLSVVPLSIFITKLRLDIKLKKCPYRWLWLNEIQHRTNPSIYCRVCTYRKVSEILILKILSNLYTKHSCTRFSTLFKNYFIHLHVSYKKEFSTFFKNYIKIKYCIVSMWGTFCVLQWWN